MTPSDLINALKWRYSVKKFDATKKITPELWHALEESLVLTPSSYGLQPWKFFVIQNAELRRQLRAYSWNQPQVEDCSHYVVFTGKKTMNEEDIQSYLERICEVRGTLINTLDGYRKSMVGDIIHGPRSKNVGDWASRQIYIALGNLLTSAAALGLDACPMEGIDTLKYDDALEIKNTNYQTICACALGYRDKEDPFGALKKVRFKKENLIVYR